MTDEYDLCMDHRVFMMAFLLDINANKGKLEQKRAIKRSFTTSIFLITKEVAYRKIKPGSVETFFVFLIKSIGEITRQNRTL